MIEVIKLKAYMDWIQGHRAVKPYDEPNMNEYYHDEWESHEQQFDSQEM